MKLKAQTAALLARNKILREKIERLDNTSVKRI